MPRSAETSLKTLNILCSQGKTSATRLIFSSCCRPKTQIYVQFSYASESAVPSIPPAKSGDIFWCLLSLVGHKEECEAVDYLLMELHRMTVLDLTPNVEDSFK